MSEPSVITSIERNPKHETVMSERLRERIKAAVDGAFCAYSDLTPAVQRLMGPTRLTFHLMNDGMTPVELRIRLVLESSGEMGAWKVESEFVLFQLSAKDPEFFYTVVRESVRKTIHEKIFMQYESMKRPTDAMKEVVEGMEKRLKSFTGIRPQ